MDYEDFKRKYNIEDGECFLDVGKLQDAILHLPSFILYVKDLSANSKILWMHIARMTRSHTFIKLSRKELASDTMCSLPTLDRRLAELKDFGLLMTVKRGLSDVSEYYLRDYKGLARMDLRGIRIDSIPLQYYLNAEVDEKDRPSNEDENERQPQQNLNTINSDNIANERQPQQNLNTINSDSSINTTTTTLSFKKDNKSLNKPGTRKILKRRATPLVQKTEVRVIKSRKRHLAQDGSLPCSKNGIKSNSNKQSKKEIQKPLFIPPKSLEAINYWLSKPCLPKMVVNLEKPTATLRKTVKALGYFFTGKIFNGQFSYLDPKLDTETVDELMDMNTLDDFKDFVDDWEEVISSGKYKVNVTWLRKTTLHDWLMGNSYVKNNNGGVFSPLVEYCFFEPQLATVDQSPATTNALMDLWKQHIGDPEKFPKEDFVKASNVVNGVFRSEFKRSGADPSGDSSYSGGIYLAVNVIVDNKEFLSSKKAGPVSLLGKWAKDQYLALWNK